MHIFNPNRLTFRQAYNPLVGLTLQRVVSLLNLAEQGYYADLQWLYKSLERRDATLRAVKRRRIAAIKKLDWSIKIREGVKGGEEQQAYLKSVYDGIDNLKDAIGFLSLAEFRGFSHLEKHYTNDGDIYHLEPVHQWLWTRKLPSRDWLYNASAAQTNNGIPIELKNFIIREVEDPVNEIALISFLRKNLAQKDWDSFVETYGIPPLFVELPPGTGGSGVTEEFQSVAERVIGDGRGVLPSGAKMVTVGESTRGVNPFQGHIDYQDKQIVMAATGGLLTALNESTGLGSGQSESHQDTFNDLAKAEALEISEAFQKQLDAVLLNEKFPNQDVLVYFELAFQEVDTTDSVISNVKMLYDAGFEVDEKQVEEKTGFKVKRKTEAAPGVPAEPVKESGQKEKINEAVKKDATKISELLKNAINLPDDQLMAELDKISNSLPSIVKTAAAESAIVEELVGKPE